MKKLFSMILILAFIISLLAGCTNTSEPVNEPVDMSDTIITTEEITKVTTPEETTYHELKIEITSDENRIYENMSNYTVIPDDEAVGEWQVVDIVENINDFDADNLKYTQEQLNWHNINFFYGGTAVLKFPNTPVIIEKWTKDYIIMSKILGGSIVTGYIIKQINGATYMFVEWKVNYIYYSGSIHYYVFKKISNKAKFDIRDVPDDMRNLDLSFADLTKMWNGFVYRQFNDKTIFPTRDKMPEPDNYQPAYILEAGKNPGLGVRSIHEQDITGKGVNVAIIDEPFYVITGHPEYKDKITEYINMTDNNRTSTHGALVTSLLAGETIGTAPGVNVYLYSPKFIVTNENKYDATPYATVLDMVVEKNKTLPEDQKIKIVSISVAPTPLMAGDNEGRPGWVNGEIYLESYNRAVKSGLLVLDASLENGIIGACKYDFETPEDVTLCSVIDSGWGKKEILAPMCFRTIAEALTEGVYSYTYQNYGGLSSAIPYAAGVLAMGWQVKPELTADEIMQILFDTAYVDKDGNKFIYPTAFIDFLKNN